jgi:hypothetical protein
MSGPGPDRWQRPLNKFIIGLYQLGLRLGPVVVLTVPGRVSDDRFVRRSLRFGSTAGRRNSKPSPAGSRLSGWSRLRVRRPRRM